MLSREDGERRRDEGEEDRKTAIQIKQKARNVIKFRIQSKKKNTLSLICLPIDVPVCVFSPIFLSSSFLLLIY